MTAVRALLSEVRVREIHVARTLPCACGRPIRALVLDPTPGVREHNATPEHRAWWQRVERDWQGEP